MSSKDILQMVMGLIIVAGLVYYVFKSKIPLVKHTGYVEGLEDKKTGTSETKTASLPKERKVLNM